jgi:hypothetical protein
MAGAGDDSADRGNPGAHQPSVIKQAFVAERVQFVDRNDVGR